MQRQERYNIPVAFSTREGFDAQWVALPMGFAAAD